MAEQATIETKSNDTPSGLAGFAGLSENDIIDFGTQSKSTTETPTAKTEGSEQPPVEEKTETVTIPGEDKPKTDDKPKEGEKPAEEEDVFQIPASESDELEEELKWVDLAKESGFEIKEDTFEAYKEAQKSYIELQKQEALKTYQDVDFKKHIETLPPESQLLIIGLKSGLTQDQIEAPFKQIAFYKGLEDADLVAEDLKLKGFEDDVINNKIEKLTEDGKLEIEAKELRTILDINENNLLTQKLNEVKELEQNITLAHQTKMKEEAAIIVQQLDTVEKFMEAPLSKNNKKFVAEKLLAGAYNDAMRDPKVIAQFALFVEFGEKGIANLKNKMYEKGRDEKVNKLHNIPPVIKSGSHSGSNQNSVKDPVGNFSAFDHLVESE